MIFVKELSKDEQQRLEDITRSTKDAKLLKRALIILLSHQGKTVPEITKIVNVHWHTVIFWIRRYEKEGISGLKTKPRSGRPPKVKEKHRKRLYEDVKKSPRLFKYRQNNWTLSLLQYHLQKRMNIVLSLEHIRRLLKQQGISFRRPKLHLVSPDPDYDIKKRYLQQLKISLPEKSILLFEDETELHLNPIIQKIWQSRGYQTKVYSPGKNQRLCVFGAMDYLSKKVIYKTAQRKTGVHFLEFLYQIRRRYYEKKIFLVIDNVSSHYTKRVKRFFQRHKEQFQIVPLPTYSPHLNPLEIFWKFFKSRVSANHFHGNILRIRHAVHQFFWDYHCKLKNIDFKKQIIQKLM